MHETWQASMQKTSVTWLVARAVGLVPGTFGPRRFALAVALHETNRKENNTPIRQEGKKGGRGGWKGWVGGNERLVKVIATGDRHKETMRNRG